MFESPEPLPENYADKSIEEMAEYDVGEIIRRHSSMHSFHELMKFWTEVIRQVSEEMVEVAEDRYFATGGK